MTPREALSLASKGFGSNFIADENPEELEGILKTALNFYSDNAVVARTAFFEMCDDKTDPTEDGVFTFDLPPDFRYMIGFSDGEGIERLYREKGEQIVIRMPDPVEMPFEMVYAVDLEEWGMDVPLPKNMQTSPLVTLLHAQIGAFNNQCLRDIGKFTQASEESPVDFDQKIAEAEQAIKDHLYIPPGKIF